MHEIDKQELTMSDFGSCEGKAEIKIRDITLLQLPFKPIDLPGKINLGGRNSHCIRFTTKPRKKGACFACSF